MTEINDYVKTENEDSIFIGFIVEINLYRKGLILLGELQQYIRRNISRREEMRPKGSILRVKQSKFPQAFAGVSQ